MNSTVYAVETSQALELCVAENLARRGMGSIMSRYFARLICDGQRGIPEADLQFSLLCHAALSDAKDEIHDRQVIDSVFSNLPALKQP